MLLVVVSLNVTALALWSAMNGRNGFAEIGKILRGEPAFQPAPQKIKNAVTLDDFLTAPGDSGDLIPFLPNPANPLLPPLTPGGDLPMI